MLWKRKPKFKLPETAAKLNYRIEFLRKILPSAQFDSLNTFSFEHGYADEITKENALELFQSVKDHMNLGDDKIQLDFFWEKPLGNKVPTEFLDTAELYKTERLTIGKYMEQDGLFTIKLGMTNLKYTNNLTFIIAHELADYVLLAQEQLFFNDEKLTDMLAMAYGFGGYWLRTQKLGRLFY